MTDADRIYADLVKYWPEYCHAIGDSATKAAIATALGDEESPEATAPCVGYKAEVTAVFAVLIAAASFLLSLIKYIESRHKSREHLNPSDVVRSLEEVAPETVTVEFAVRIRIVRDKIGE